MIKDYYTRIPPHLFDVLQEISGSTSEDFDTVITVARAAFFNFNYPVPPDKKEDFENFILNRFILRRIGSGNVRKWRQMFKAKLLEIMPYYNNLMLSEMKEYDPLINNDIETTDGTTRDKKTDNDDVYAKSGSETASNRELNRFSDTPQGDSSRVWETDGQGNITLSDYYITDVRGITNNATRTWNENGNDQRDITEHETVDFNDYKLGVSGSSKSKLLNEWRETFLRLYEAIAEELQPLFYNLVEVDDLIDFV